MSRNYSFSKLVHVAHNSASNSFIDTLYRYYIFIWGTINSSDVHWQVIKISDSEPTHGTEIIYSEQSIFQGPDNITSSVKYGLLKD